MDTADQSRQEGWTPAEIALIDAIDRGIPCDLSPGSPIDQTDSANWRDERVIRSELLDHVLRQMVDNSMRGQRPHFELRGAVISGPLYELIASQRLGMSFEGCRFDDGVQFKDVEFLGDVSFKSCHFVRRTMFDGCTFTSFVDFNDSEFSDKVYLNACNFLKSVTFEGIRAQELNISDCEFSEVSFFQGSAFGGRVSLYDTRFKDTAYLGRCFFSHDFTVSKSSFNELHLGASLYCGEVSLYSSKCNSAWFAEAVFLSEVRFSQVQFSSFAYFAKVIALGPVRFHEVTFNEHTNFAESTFAEFVRFDSCEFHDLKLERAVSKKWDFWRSTFEVADVGTIVGEEVDLTAAVLNTRGRVIVAAGSIDGSWLSARQGIHLVLRANRVVLNDADFARQSIISSYEISDLKRLTQLLPDEQAGDQGAPAGDHDLPELAAERMKAQNTVSQVRADVFRVINSLPVKCSIESLRRSNMSEVVLSDVQLSKCRFAGAHGLDKVRLGSDCTFEWVPGLWQRRHFAPRRAYARRRLLHEELLWRRGGELADSPSPLEISAIYRDLRKSLEDGKNEPAAADFYYGEMEMRRLAKRTVSPLTGRSAMGTPLVERMLLTAYWALSGYGLRASRAIVALMALLLIGAAIFLQPAFASFARPQDRVESFDPHSGLLTYAPAEAPRALNYSDALVLAARSALSLVQPRSADSEVVIHGPGVPVEFALRLGGPALLALAILAVRGRTRR